MWSSVTERRFTPTPPCVCRQVGLRPAGSWARGSRTGTSRRSSRSCQATIRHADLCVRSDCPERTRCAQKTRECVALQATLGSEGARGEIGCTREAMFALVALMRRRTAAISGRPSSEVLGTPAGIFGSSMATVAGWIENAEADSGSADCNDFHLSNASARAPHVLAALPWMAWDSRDGRSFCARSSRRSPKEPFRSPSSSLRCARLQAAGVYPVVCRKCLQRCG